MKTKNFVDAVVVITPRYPIGGSSKNKAIMMCEEIISEIESLSFFNTSSMFAPDVDIKKEYEPVCEHCGWNWTEDNIYYNGGCCDKDVEVGEEIDKVGLEQYIKRQEVKNQIRQASKGN